MMATTAIHYSRVTLLSAVITCLLSTSQAFLQPGFRKDWSQADCFSNNKVQRQSICVFLSSRDSPADMQRRQQLLQRDGPFFQLNRNGGNVEFGATADLITQLNPQRPDLPSVNAFLSDEGRVAFSIWDKKLIQEIDKNVFRLKVMKLQFVTIQLQPSVDVKMWTEVSPGDSPVFRLQSVAFEPNLQVVPGLSLSAKSLGIKIEVVGELQPTVDGKGVTGKITFTTSGILPPPMRLLPEPILKAASDAINQTITKFAIQSFQKGALSNYKEFLRARQLGSKHEWTKNSFEDIQWIAHAVT